jgi:hypothetical protein
MKTLDAGVTLYEDRDLKSPAVHKLPAGAEFSTGSESMREGRQWVEATLADGRTGYALGPSVRSHCA